MQVTQATQSNAQTTMADVFRYFIYLASVLKGAVTSNLLPYELLHHAVRSFNARWQEMATGIVRLALFLHPGYKIISFREGEFEYLQKTVSTACFCLL